MPNTVKLHRVFKTKPERLYKAFLDPQALVKWIPPHGFTARVDHLDARVGGTYHMSFTNFGGEYLELVPNRKIVHTDKFDDPNMPGVLKVTIEIKPVMCGAEIHITQENLPDAIPVEMCYLGWSESLDLLKLLVEPEIPDGA